LDIVEMCDMHPLPTKKVLYIENAMKPSIMKLLDDLETSQTVDKIKTDSDQIVINFLSLKAIGSKQE
jgi:hypothetical protein